MVDKLSLIYALEQCNYSFDWTIKIICVLLVIIVGLILAWFAKDGLLELFGRRKNEKDVKKIS